MPRKHLIRSKIHPYHITARCNNKEPFYSNLEDVWEIITTELSEVANKFQFRIHAFVLMSNHFHLLGSTEKDHLGIVMQTFMINITKKINRHCDRTGRVFGSRYHWTLIDNDHYYDCALKYVYRNPVKARLVDAVERYEFSTLNGLILDRPQKVKIDPRIGHASLIPDENKINFLNWLNQPFQNEEDVAIKRALMRTRFDFSKPDWKRKKEKVE